MKGKRSDRYFGFVGGFVAGILVVVASLSLNHPERVTPNFYSALAALIPLLLLTLFASVFTRSGEFLRESRRSSRTYRELVENLRPEVVSEQSRQLDEQAGRVERGIARLQRETVLLALTAVVLAVIGEVATLWPLAVGESTLYTFMVAVGSAAALALLLIRMVLDLEFADFD